MTALTVDKEFASLCPPLLPEEMNLLEASLESEGCRDPIIVWANHNNTILDGHTRYAYCKKHNKTFKTKALMFDFRGEAINWIIANQLGRRNLSDEQKSYLRGRRYEAEKKEEGRPDKLGQNVPVFEHGTASKLAAEYNVDEKTIRRDAKFAEAVDTLAEKHGPEVRKQILSGQSQLSKSDILRLPQLTEKQQEKAIETGEMPQKKMALKRNATITEKAIVIKEAIQNGLTRAKALSKYGLKRDEYDRAYFISQFGNPDLIDAVNNNIIALRTAYITAIKTPGKIQDLIDSAKLKAESKKHRPMNLKDHSNQDKIRELLGRTYVDWSGFRHNVPINRSSIPSNPEKLKEIVTLCKNIRNIVNEYINRIEKEIQNVHKG